MITHIVVLCFILSLSKADLLNLDDYALFSELENSLNLNDYSSEDKNNEDLDAFLSLFESDDYFLEDDFLDATKETINEYVDKGTKAIAENGEVVAAVLDKVGDAAETYGMITGTVGAVAGAISVACPLCAPIALPVASAAMQMSAFSKAISTGAKLGSMATKVSTDFSKEYQKTQGSVGEKWGNALKTAGKTAVKELTEKGVDLVGGKIVNKFTKHIKKASKYVVGKTLAKIDNFKAMVRDKKEVAAKAISKGLEGLIEYAPSKIVEKVQDQAKELGGKVIEKIKGGDSKKVLDAVSKVGDTATRSAAAASAFASSFPTSKGGKSKKLKNGLPETRGGMPKVDNLKRKIYIPGFNKISAPALKKLPRLKSDPTKMFANMKKLPIPGVNKISAQAMSGSPIPGLRKTVAPKMKTLKIPGLKKISVPVMKKSPKYKTEPSMLKKMMQQAKKQSKTSFFDSLGKKVNSVIKSNKNGTNKKFNVAQTLFKNKSTTAPTPKLNLARIQAMVMTSSKRTTKNQKKR